MKKAAILIDKYKKDVFTKRLQEAGIPYEIKEGPTENSYSLRIEGETMQDLTQWRGLIEKINNEATR